MWMVIILCAIVFCTLEVKKLYQIYDESQIILVFDEDQHLLNEIVFPAITFQGDTLMDFDYTFSLDSFVLDALLSFPDFSYENSTKTFIKEIQDDGSFER